MDRGSQFGDLAWADLRSTFNPNDTAPLSHFKRCPQGDLCGHPPFVQYKRILNHLISVHAMGDEEATKMLGTRDECNKKWKEEGRRCGMKENKAVI